MAWTTGSAGSPSALRPTAAPSAGRQALWYSVALGSATAVTGFLYLISARGLTPAQFGSVASWLAIATFSASLIDFGTNSAWVRDLSRGSLTTREVGRRMGGKLVAGFLFTVCGFAGLAEIGLVGAFSGLYATLLVTSQMATVPLRADQRPRVILSATVVDRGLALGFLVVSTSLGLDPAVVLPMALCCGSAAGTVVLVLRSPRRKEFLSGLVRPAAPWRGALYFGLASLITSAQVLDQPLTLVIAGSRGAGDLGAVTKWTMPIAILGTAMSNAMGPITGSSSGLRDAVRKSRSLLPLLVLGVASGVMMSVLAPFLVDLLLGSAYEGSVPIFRLLAIAAAICAVSQPLVALLQFSGFDRAVFLVMVPSVILQFALLAPLLLSLGSVGAAWAALIAQAAILTGLSGILVVQWRRQQFRPRS